MLTVYTSNTISDTENATSLSKTSLFLYTTNSLFEDGGDFGWACLRVGGICADRVDNWSGYAGLGTYQYVE